MQKLQEHLAELRSEFHKRCGFEFGFDLSQSEAHFDLTTQAALNYLQAAAMSGKINELKDIVSHGGEAIVQSSFYTELMEKCTASYYALDWDKERKEKLAATILTFTFDGLKYKFQSGGYSNDLQGVLSFVGLDSGMLGMLGKMGGMFSGFGKWFK